MSDDWQVVEEALTFALSTKTKLPRDFPSVKKPTAALAALARLREREAQREAQIGQVEADVGFLTDYLGAQGDLIERVKGWKDRAERAEAELRDLLNEVDCRIEHGAESGGHLEYVRTRLTAALSEEPLHGTGQDGC